jgi:hypothetical protein
MSWTGHCQKGPAIVASILAAGVPYEATYLGPRRDTHWILLDPPVGEPDA